MEDELRAHLTACLTAFMSATGWSRTAVAIEAASDRSFFVRIQDKSFTAKKYDAVMAWFARNWPANTPWPGGVPRPAAEQGAAA